MNKLKNRAAQLLIGLSLIISYQGFAQKSDRAMQQLIKEDMKFAAEQYKILIKNTPDDLMPRNFNAAENKLVTSKTDWWTSGFFLVHSGIFMSIPGTARSGWRRRSASRFLRKRSFIRVIMISVL